MTPEAAIALVESFMEEVWAACNPSSVDRFVTEDFVITSAGVDVAGRENFKAWVAGFQSKIADLKWEPIETFATPTARACRRASASPAATTACSGCRRMVSRSRSQATPSWPSHPPGSSPTTGSSAVPGSSTTS